MKGICIPCTVRRMKLSCVSFSQFCRKNLSLPLWGTLPPLGRDWDPLPPDVTSFDLMLALQALVWTCFLDPAVPGLEFLQISEVK